MAITNRDPLTEALAVFQDQSLKDAAGNLLNVLGYRSERSLKGSDSSPRTFLELFSVSQTDRAFDQEKALVSEWKTADLLFQLTDQELSRDSSLFKDTSVKSGLLKSYVFIAIELKGSDYARGKFSSITRQINRLFPMPVMVIFKHGDKLTISVINRRRSKVDDSKDVLEKATLIRDIAFARPHRGHLDILASMAVTNLVHPQRLPVNNFDNLHASWERIFNIELLNDRFYRELSSWYFWAMRHIHFPPADIEADKSGLFQSDGKVREQDAKHLIRLLTRLLFVWFIKEKGLIPADFFQPETIAENYLDGFQVHSKETRYYKAILQNLFFATLNRTKGKREFRKDGQHQNTTTLLRYRRLLKNPANFIETVEAVVPFLNGGLFECLDHPHATKTGPQSGRAIVYVDGFSDRDDNPLKVPDFLFFGPPEQIDLSEEFGDTKRKKEMVRGLIHIFESFKFTIVENTPIDQEIALDPELLGKVFENLLASYNPETKTTARKQTGSFYTPRSIVDYMVDESLKAHLSRNLVEKAGMTETDALAGLEILFAYTEREHSFSSREVTAIIETIDTCSILDPACGSGAFPMGVLHKLVHVLAKLDPNDRLWKERQLKKVDATIHAASEIDDAAIRESTIADLEGQKTDIEETFTRNELGYGRKLFLIENCIYGVDIQSIATQVSKLRFFISLVVDQIVDPARENFGIRPLPNLETKFVTADTLIAISSPEVRGDQSIRELFEIADVSKLQKELKTVRHNLFSAKTQRTKEKYRARDKELREAIAAELETNGWDSEVAAKLARWDPYNQNASADFFDPEWMFNRPYFDAVIGNPPWGATLTKAQKERLKADYPEIDSSTPNSFAYFLGAALRQSKQSIAFVLPDSILIKDYARTRELIAPKLTDIAWYLNTGVPESCRQFVYVEHDVCVLILNQNKSSASCRIRKQFYDPTEKENRYESYEELKANFIFKEQDFCFNLLIRSKERAILQKLAGHVSLGSITQCHEGIHTGNSRDLLFHDRAINKFCKPLFYGGRAGDHIANYYSERSNWYVDYRESIIDKDQGFYASLRDERIFVLPKIYITRTGNPIMAFYDLDTYASNNFFSLQLRDYSKNSEENLKAILPLILSSLANYYIRTFAAPRLGNTYIETKIIHLNRIPVSADLLRQSGLFLSLTNLMIVAVKGRLQAQKQFLSDLIDACVMECYFHDHMADRDLLLHDAVAPHLATYDAEGSDANQRKFVTDLCSALNAPSHPIRNRLLRLTADSPDLLAVIKEQGRV